MIEIDFLRYKGLLSGIVMGRLMQETAAILQDRTRQLGSSMQVMLALRSCNVVGMALFLWELELSKVGCVCRQEDISVCVCVCVLR
jgi:hypothetical protein